MDRDSSIGVFDSGLGGLTVVQALHNLLPHENITYFGDTAHLPFGSKSHDAICRYTLAGARFLSEQKIKLLVIACHTACSLAFETLNGLFPFPVLGVIEPSIDDLQHEAGLKKIAILGTQATISSGVYQQKIHQYLPEVSVIGIACPLFVPLVEEGYIDHPVTSLIIREYIKPIHDQAIGTILLGCTHYPLLKDAIEQEVGKDKTFVDPAASAAKKIKKMLSAANLLNDKKGNPEYRFYVSDHPEKFRAHGKAYLDYPIDDVRKI